MDDLKFGTLFKFYDDEETYRFIRYFGLKENILYENSRGDLCQNVWTRIEKTVSGQWYHNKVYVVTIFCLRRDIVKIFHSESDAYSFVRGVNKSDFEIRLQDVN